MGTKGAEGVLGLGLGLCNDPRGSRCACFFKRFFASRRSAVSGGGFEAMCIEARTFIVTVPGPGLTSAMRRPRSGFDLGVATVEFSGEAWVLCPVWGSGPLFGASSRNRPRPYASRLAGRRFSYRLFMNEQAWRNAER